MCSTHYITEKLVLMDARSYNLQMCVKYDLNLYKESTISKFHASCVKTIMQIPQWYKIMLSHSQESVFLQQRLEGLRIKPWSPNTHHKKSMLKQELRLFTDNLVAPLQATSWWWKKSSFASCILLDHLYQTTHVYKFSMAGRSTVTLPMLSN